MLLRAVVLLAVLAASIPAVAMASDPQGSDLVSWRLGIPAAVLASVVALARWIKRRLADGSLTITATSASAKALTDETAATKAVNETLRSENAALKMELEKTRARLEEELEETKANFREQLARLEERELRWLDMALSDRSGEHEPVD
jgi:hypothetical protein